MSGLLLWTGPVSTYDLRHVVWPVPVDVLVFSSGPSGGIGSSSFAQLAASVTDPTGHLLPTLLAHARTDAGHYDRVAVAGFSAAHGLMSPLLGADGDSLAGAVCLDACFSDPRRLVKPGYLAYGTRAARGERLFVMSASSGGGLGSGHTIGPGVPDYSTGYACMLSTFDAAAAQAGASPTSIDRSLPPGLPPITDPKGSARQAGLFTALDYHDQYKHGDHVHVLAKPILEAYLGPLFAGQAPIAPGGTPARAGGPSFAAVATAAGAVGLLAWVLYKSQRVEKTLRLAGSQAHAREHVGTPSRRLPD